MSDIIIINALDANSIGKRFSNRNIVACTTVVAVSQRYLRSTTLAFLAGSTVRITIFLPVVVPGNYQ